MFLLKCTILCIILFIIPFFLGSLITYRDDSPITRSVSLRYILGFFTALSLFWILCVPLTFMRISFTILTLIYSLCLTVLCWIYVWIYCKNRFYAKQISKPKALKLTGYETIYLIAFLILLGVQIYFAAFYDFTFWTHDDYNYVVCSLDAITSDHMFSTDLVSGNEAAFSASRVFNSWQIYIAYLSKISGFHVTTVAHTIIPVVFLLLAYLVYTYVAGRLFQKREAQLIFLCILSAAFIFGAYSPYSLTFRLLVTLWQGKAVLSAIVIPFLISFLLEAYRQKYLKRIWLYLLIISMSACSLTMMGSAMTIVIFAATVIVASIYKRRLTGISYCFWGCVIPIVQILLYLIMR